MRSILLHTVLSSMYLFLIKITCSQSRCYSGIDIVQLQDITWSFDMYWNQMSEFIEDGVNTIMTNHPNSRFGFASFGDKHILHKNSTFYQQSILSTPQKEYCLRVDIPLQRLNGTSVKRFVHSFPKSSEGSGGDWPEAIFESLYRSILTKKLSWRNNEQNDGTLIERVIVLVTDTLSHNIGDVKKIFNVNVLPFTTIIPHIRNGCDENYQCENIDYPDIEQVIKYLNKEKIKLIVLVATTSHSHQPLYTPTNIFTTTHLSSVPHEYNDESGFLSYYTKIFHMYGLKNVIVAPLDLNMAIYSQTFHFIMDKFKKYQCHDANEPHELISPAIKAVRCDNTLFNPIMNSDRPLQNSTRNNKTNPIIKTLSHRPFISHDIKDNTTTNDVSLITHETQQINSTSIHSSQTHLSAVTNRYPNPCEKVKCSSCPCTSWKNIMCKSCPCCQQKKKPNDYQVIVTVEINDID